MSQWWQTIDRQSIDAGESYGSYGIAEGLTNLFNSFQSLSANPTSTAERQTVLFNAQKLADKMNRVDSRLSDLQTSINEEQDFEVEQHIERILTDVQKNFPQHWKMFDELYLCNYSMDFGS